MHVRMGHLKSDDGNANALAWNGGFDFTSNIACEHIDPRQCLRIQVKEVIDFCFGNDQGMAHSEWVNVEKGEEFIVFGDAMARNLTGNDFAEDA